MSDDEINRYSDLIKESDTSNAKVIQQKERPKRSTIQSGSKKTKSEDAENRSEEGGLTKHLEEIKDDLFTMKLAVFKYFLTILFFILVCAAFFAWFLSRLYNKTISLSDGYTPDKFDKNTSGFMQPGRGKVEGSGEKIEQLIDLVSLINQTSNETLKISRNLDSFVTQHYPPTETADKRNTRDYDGRYLPAKNDKRRDYPIQNHGSADHNIPEHKSNEEFLSQFSHQLLGLEDYTKARQVMDACLEKGVVEYGRLLRLIDRGAMRNSFLMEDGKDMDDQFAVFGISESSEGYIVPVNKLKWAPSKYVNFFYDYSKEKLDYISGIQSPAIIRIQEMENGVIEISILTKGILY